VGRGPGRLVGEHNQLRAVACAKLRHGVVDVRLDGERAECELAGDVRVGHPVGDQGGHGPGYWYGGPWLGITLLHAVKE
jgi:hypothetical protein